jgi:L-alanine-DL-glutamate epimerase-like enolase superfamily enzyme
MERGHLDVIQPDVTRCGGLTEALRIAREAEARHVAVVPHAWKSGVIKAASLHLNAVLASAHFQEYCVAETPINRLLTRERMPIENGWVEVPGKPGLGIELDSEVLERYAVDPKPLPVR